MILALAFKSLRNRRLTAALTVLSIALSVALLLAVERVRLQSRESFTSAVSGTDLIVGSRTSPVHLLLLSVFRVGDAGNSMRWQSYRALASWPEVAWAIALSLGDSHRGFRVLGTSPDYFEHFHFGRERGLVFVRGARFAAVSDAVLGADVAESLHYDLGQRIVLAHGTGEVAFQQHEELPLRVVGILARTGTPVDRTIHVSLEAIETIHAEPGARASDPLAAAVRAARPPAGDPRTLTAILVGLKSRAAALSVQRAINEYTAEPLTAVLPGVTLLQLWEIVGAAERSLRAVSILVVAVGFASMLVALLTGLNERRREMAILRSVGARPAHVFAFILGEAMSLTLLGVALGVTGVYGALLAGRGWLEAHLGVSLPLRWPSAYEFGVIGILVAAGTLVGIFPAYRSYRFSLADGLTPRI